jgi:hypothetical protein
MNDLTLPDHFVVGMWATHQAHISLLWKSERSARQQINASLASIQSSLLLLDEVERPTSRPVALPMPGGQLLETVALQRDNPKTETRSQPVCWDIYPDVPKAIRLGEVEAADEREAIEKAAKRFQQDPAVLIVVRRL